MKIKDRRTQIAIINAIQRNMSVAELEPLGLSIRVIHLLEDKLGVIYINDLVKITSKDVKGVGHLGTEALRETQKALDKLPYLTNQIKDKHLCKVVPNIHRVEELRNL